MSRGLVGSLIMEHPGQLCSYQFQFLPLAWNYRYQLTWKHLSVTKWPHHCSACGNYRSCHPWSAKIEHYHCMAPGSCGNNFKRIPFKFVIQNNSLCTLWNCCQANATEPQQWKVNFGLGNGLVVPSGNKPLPEPILTQIYVAIERLWATMR